MKFKNVVMVASPKKGLTKVCCNNNCKNFDDYDECFFLDKDNKIVAHFKTEGYFSVYPSELSYKNIRIFVYKEYFSEKNLSKYKIIRVNDDLTWKILHEVDDILMKKDSNVGLIKKEGLWGVIDYNGVIFIKPQYENGNIYSEDGLAKVCQNNKWGIVNMQNKFIIPCKYDSIRRFDKSFFIVSCKDPESTNIINMLGDIVYQIKSKAFNLGNGSLLVKNSDGEFEIINLV